MSMRSRSAAQAMHERRTFQADAAQAEEILPGISNLSGRLRLGMIMGGFGAPAAKLELRAAGEGLTPSR